MFEQKNKIKEAEEIYKKTRLDTDSNLIDDVVSMLKRYNFSQDQINIFLNNKLIVPCKDKVFEVQRVNVNRFWNMQLMQCDKETVEIRYHLLSDGSIENWLVFFEKIINFIKDNNLPREFH